MIDLDISTHRTSRSGTTRDRTMRFNHSGSGFRYSYSNSKKLVNGSDRSLATNDRVYAVDPSQTVNL